MSNSESASSDRSIFSECRMWILHITLSKGTCWKLGSLQHGISHHTQGQLNGLPVQRPTSQNLINKNEADTRYLKFSVLQICLSRKGTTTFLNTSLVLSETVNVSSIHRIIQVRRDLRRCLVQPPAPGQVSCEVR